MTLDERSELVLNLARVLHVNGQSTLLAATIADGMTAITVILAMSFRSHWSEGRHR
jgi:hypothetical protein